MQLWYDKAGEPIDEREAFRLRYDMTPGADGAVSEYARIGRDEVGDARVSTVWLGLDHSFGSAPPLIFETMIFGGDHDGYCRRYSTEAAAVAGHAATVAALKAGMAPPEGDW